MNVFPTEEKITAWSHSRLNNYEKCPRKAYFLYVRKLKEPDNIYAARGNEVHKMLEEAMRDKQPLPELCSGPPRDFLEAIADEDCQCELQLAFDADWNPCDWFSPNTFLRVVIDLLVVEDAEALVVDHKTGKIYPEHEKQAKLYALAVFKKWGVKKVAVRFTYIDQEKVGHYDYTEADIPALEASIAERVRLPLQDRTFPADPGKNCRWCYFRRSNGGPCEHG